MNTLKKMKCALSFASLALLASTALAEGKFFSVSRAIPEEYMARSSEFANELKHEVVENWLRRHLGDAFENVEEEVTPKFTEAYILDFTNRRYAKGSKAYLKVEGHIDSERLKLWANKARVSADNPTFFPLYILSSDYPGHRITPQQTASRIEDNLFAKTVTQVFKDAIGRSGMRPNISNLRNLPALSPVRSKNKLRLLGEIADERKSKTGLWLHLSSCYRCGGGRMELYMYRFDPPRVVLTDSVDLKMQQSDLQNEEKIKEIFTPALTQFQAVVDGTVTKGTLMSSTIKLLVKGLSYTKHRTLENALTQLDYVVSVVPRAVTSDAAQFEVMTSLNPSEFSKRIKRTRFAGFNIKVLRVDSDLLVVRYWKPQG